ncbi:MAG TPA: peptidoglycan DD-metalloendopeptidase family protein [Clostridia bacterium]|nr:peptidoglycan DD-metalloendopeptidase family protein [Clostridia bacterium]
MGNVGCKSYKFFNLLNEYKKNLIAFLVALAIGFAFVVYEEGFAYKVTVNGMTVGVTKNAEEVKSMIEKIYGEESQKLGTEVVLDQEVKITRVRVQKKDLTDANKIYENLKNALSFTCKAGVIMVNGNFVAALKNKEEAQRALESLKGKYAKEGEKIYFKENIEIKDKYISPSKLVTIEEAIGLLQQPVEKAITYSVKENDSLWSIARDHDMYIQDILKLNPGLTENLKPGQVIYLAADIPLVTVVTEREITYKEEIPYETKFTKDDKLYTNQSKVLREGKKGLKEVAAVVVSYNGIEVSKDIKKEEIIEKPVDKIVAVGSKRISYVATGSFSYPARGTITSRFGSRWGGFHTGVDIAAPEGTPIYAADGGTVIFSGWEGGYGYLVKIDHHNGYVTYYGHASKLLVKEGDKIEKGQKIALVGSTGHATGPHVHFEVRKNGVPIDPMPFLR